MSDQKTHKEQCLYSQGGPVTLKIPTHPIYMGNFVRVSVAIQGKSRITLDDLEFSIPAGRHGGQISISSDITSNAGQPEVVLIAGYRPGTYALRCTHRQTGQVMGEIRFTITDMTY